MRKALREIAALEAFLSNRLPPADAAAFAERLRREPDLRDQALRQRAAYHLIRRAGRRQLRRELNALHRRLQNDPARTGFWERIRRIFENREP